MCFNWLLKKVIRHQALHESIDAPDRDISSLFNSLRTAEENGSQVLTACLQLWIDVLIVDVVGKNR